MKIHGNVTIIFSKEGYYSENLTVGSKISVSGVVVRGLSSYGMLVDTKKRCYATHVIPDKKQRENEQGAIDHWKLNSE